MTSRDGLHTYLPAAPFLVSLRFAWEGHTPSLFFASAIMTEPCSSARLPSNQHVQQREWSTRVGRLEQHLNAGKRALPEHGSQLGKGFESFSRVIVTHAAGTHAAKR